MDISFLWSWLTPDEWAVVFKSAALGVGVTEVVKRGALMREEQIHPGAQPTGLGKFTLWVLAIGVTAAAAAGGTLSGTGVEHVAALTLPQWIDIVTFALMVGPVAPLAHWLVLLKGADFLAWLIENRTGYHVNLREVAAGRTYKVHKMKRVRKADGTEEDRPADAPSGEGEVTTMRDLPPRDGA